MIAALLLAAVSCVPLPSCVDNGNVSPCASPTPTLAWDAVPDVDIAGYDLYEREPGGPLQFLASINCEWSDNGIAEVRACRGIDIDAAVQRYCSFCAPYTLHEFAVLAYDTSGNRSVAFSNVVSICFSPICSAPGPCS
jgi:hypothetical protein